MPASKVRNDSDEYSGIIILYVIRTLLRTYYSIFVLFMFNGNILWQDCLLTLIKHALGNQRLQLHLILNYFNECASCSTLDS